MGNIEDLKVRRANPDDVLAIRSLGLDDEAFKVSDQILFYEIEELMEWTLTPHDNWLYVAERNNTLVGFFFIKIMSRHWAMLDNFYVLGNARKTGVATSMLKTLHDALRCRGITYLSTLISRDDPHLRDSLLRCGFNKSRAYEWFEYFIPEKPDIDQKTYCVIQSSDEKSILE